MGSGPPTACVGFAGRARPSPAKATDQGKQANSSVQERRRTVLSDDGRFQSSRRHGPAWSMLHCCSQPVLGRRIIAIALLQHPECTACARRAINKSCFSAAAASLCCSSVHGLQNPTRWHSRRVESNPPRDCVDQAHGPPFTQKEDIDSVPLARPRPDRACGKRSE